MCTSDLMIQLVYHQNPIHALLELWYFTVCGSTIKLKISGKIVCVSRMLAMDCCRKSVMQDLELWNRCVEQKKHISDSVNRHLNPIAEGVLD